MFPGLVLLAACASSDRPKNTTAADMERSEGVNYTDFIQYVSEIFSVVDVSKNGYVEASEFGKIPAWLAESKQSSKSRISRSDFMRVASQKFKDFAKANPKYLSPSEMKALQATTP